MGLDIPTGNDILSPCGPVARCTGAFLVGLLVFDRGTIDVILVTLQLGSVQTGHPLARRAWEALRPVTSLSGLDSYLSLDSSSLSSDLDARGPGTGGGGPSE